MDRAGPSTRDGNGIEKQNAYMEARQPAIRSRNQPVACRLFYTGIDTEDTKKPSNIR